MNTHGGAHGGSEDGSAAPPRTTPSPAPNPTDPDPTSTPTCATFREAVSAALDGEGTMDDLQRHGDVCPECAHWFDDLVRVNRRLRMRLVGGSPHSADTGAPDLVGRVLSLVVTTDVCGCGETCGCGEHCSCGDLCACHSGGGAGRGGHSA